MHLEPLSAVPADMTPTSRAPRLASTVRSRPAALPSFAAPGMWQKLVAQLTVRMEAPLLPPVQLRALPPVPVAPPAEPPPLPVPPLPMSPPALLPPVPALTTAGSIAPEQPKRVNTEASATASRRKPNLPETLL